MESRIMQVFYGNDLLPYKDKERTVHYPITGGAIAGSNNVTKIRFYVDQVGGTESVSWVVVSKLPNGKLGYEPISDVQPDDELGKKYIEFDLSSYYTSVKGDLYLALRGYEGEITFEDDDDDGIYKIVGDPLIQVTGTIKLPINYSPMVNTGTQVLPTDVDRLIASLSEYIKVGDGIQIFNATITTTFAELYAKTVTKEFILFYGNEYYIGRFRNETTIYMETISRINNSKVTYSKSGLDTSDRVATLFSYNNEDRVAFGKTTIWYTYGSDTTDFDDLLQDLDYLGGHDSTKPFIFKLTSSENGYEGYYLCQADTMGYPNCHFVFRQIDGDRIFKGVRNSYQTYDLRDFFNPSYLFTQTNEEYVDSEVGGVYDYVNENFLNKDDGGIVDGDVTFNGHVIVPTPTQNNEAANKGYVDNAIQEFLQNEFQAVDTTEYPTLDSFLASTGEEGYIYLYPTGVNNDYYQYIWEGSWVSLGTTQLDLSNYYTKSETDTLLNGKVDKTSSANKVYGTNDQGAQITYTVDDFYDGNIARRDSDGSITVPLTPSANGEATSKKYVDDSVATKQDTLVSGTNIKTLNNESLLGSGNISYDSALSSSSTNAVQNKVITQNVLDLQYRVSLLEEAIISKDTLSYTHLSESLIPQLSDNSYPIIQSGGLDTKEIKGRSFVYNQKIGLPFVTTGTTNVNVIDNNDGTIDVVVLENISGTVYATIKNIYPSEGAVSGNKYLVKGGLSSSLSLTAGALEDSGSGVVGTITFSSSITVNLKLSNINAGTYKITPQLFDLTQSGIDSATTVDQAIALLQQNGINPYEFNEYNAGKIIDSKPTAIVSNGYNLFNGELEQGVYSGTTGEPVTYNPAIRSKSTNYIKVFGGKEYTLEKGNISSQYAIEYQVYQYDKNKTFISKLQNSNGLFTLSGNCAYIRFAFAHSSTTTLVIPTNPQVCLHLTGTRTGYAPYKAPITYPLSTPILRSARKSQDNNLKVNIGVADLGRLDWSYDSGSSEFVTTSLSTLAKGVANNDTLANFICSKYPTKTANQIYLGQIGISNTALAYIYVRDSAYTDAAAFKAAMSGVILNYELATSTDQPYITLPEDIEIELGGSLEVLYDNGYTTPCDFVFDTAVYKPIQ